MLLYADDLIKWTTGDSEGGAKGIGGSPAQVGFVSDNDSSFLIDHSGTSAIISIDTATNYGIGG